jgi:excisionase family DNA binding protein
MPRLHVDSTKRLLSVSEAADVFGLSPYTLRLWVKQGKVPVIRLDSTVRIDRLDLEATIQSAKQQWAPHQEFSDAARKGHQHRKRQQEAVSAA